MRTIVITRKRDAKAKAKASQRAKKTETYITANGLIMKREPLWRNRYSFGVIA